MATDEERCLLPRRESNLNECETSEKAFSPQKVSGVMLASTGVFISGIDQSFITASYVDIASSMKEMNNAFLLLNAYNLGYCVALPLYGKLSDRCGRKGPLLGAYLIFSAGCLLSGISLCFWQIILGRAVTGFGAAGMVSLVCVVITDSVPPSRVASMRSYVTIVSVLGRCSGGIIGAFILENFGWQWSFILQIPFVFICSLASLILMPETRVESSSDDDGTSSFIKNFDLLGILLFILAIGTFLKATSQEIPNSKTLLESSFSTMPLLSCIFGLSFLVTEIFYAKSPFLPLSSLGTTINAYLVIQIIIFVAHDTHIANLPPYFLFVEKFQTTTTAIYLITSSIGFSAGSVIGGHTIKWTHRMKAQSIFGLIFGILVYLLIALQWTQDAHLLEATYTFLAGVMHGILLSALFGALAATCSRSMIASSITSYYLCQQVGSILGTGLSTAALQGIFRASLSRNLPETPQKQHIITEVLKDINFFKMLPIQWQQQIQDIFLASFKKIAYMTTGVACLALPIVLVSPEQIMD